MMSATSNFTAKLMVGMEVHVELATRSKMFTAAPNIAHHEYEKAQPNTLCDPVVLGMPGVLPVVNRQAVEMAMLVGLALGCKIARFTKWDRKSYYYPDLPKNYQISQYDQPLCEHGCVEVPMEDGSTKTIRILRAHLEEDAGKLLHEAPGGHAIDGSIVDLNRAGTPLLEIVTQPDFETAEQVVAFAQLLRHWCRALGVTQGIMQQGHMRFEPNINVIIERDGQTYKTPIVEIKNLNSFKALSGAVNYEYERQIDEWQRTGKTMAAGAKSTRGWDDDKQCTFLQREKEDAHDYRYFPDPDLVPVVVNDDWLKEVRTKLVDPPYVREKVYVEKLGLGVKEARQILDDPATARFFEAMLKEGIDAKRAVALLLNNLARRANERGVTAGELGIAVVQVKTIDQLMRDNKVSSNAADQLLDLCIADPQADPLPLAEKHGLMQVSDDTALSGWCDAAMAQNPKSVEAVKAGKDAAIGALVGAVMKLSKGKANPKVVGEMLRKKIGG